MSSIADRTIYPAPGLQRGGAGAAGELVLNDDVRPNPKALLDLKPGDVVHLNLPGGGGYGDPFQRDPQRVLWDVIEGYVSAQEAETKYGVAIRYQGSAEDWVRLPEQWMIDQVRTAKLRRREP